jgi:hypothetical protein
MPPGPGTAVPLPAPAASAPGSAIPPAASFNAAAIPLPAPSMPSFNAAAIPLPAPSVPSGAAELPVIALPPPGYTQDLSAEDAAPPPVIELESESIDDEETLEPEAALEEAEIEEDDEEVPAMEAEASLPEIDIGSVTEPEPPPAADEEDETASSGAWTLEGVKVQPPPPAEALEEVPKAPVEEPPAVVAKPRAPIELGELSPESEEPLQLAATWEFVTQGAGAAVHAGHESTPSWESRGVDLETPAASAPEAPGNPQDKVALVPTWSFVPPYQPAEPAVPVPPSPPKPPATVTPLSVLAPELSSPEPTTHRYGITSAASPAVTTTAKYGVGPAASSPLPGFPEVQTDPFEEFVAPEGAPKPPEGAAPASVPWDDNAGDKED